MKIVPEKSEVLRQIRAEESRYKRFSTRALLNMYEFATWRVMQLEHQGGVLRFLGAEGGELEDLFSLAERIERVERNHARFEAIRQALLYELMVRGEE